jgi:cell division protein FtsL
VNKLVAILLVALAGCALALVSAQHRARTLFTELEAEQEYAKKLDAGWRQLQVDQSRWATHSRIEKIARSTLKMDLPDPAEVRIINSAAPEQVVSAR